MSISSVPNSIGLNVRVPDGPGQSDFQPSYTVSGPSQTVYGYPSITYTYTPTDLIASDVLTPNDGGAGGSFSPTSRTLTNTTAAQSFQYTSVGPGTVGISGSSTSGNPFIDAPLSLTILEQSCLNIQSNAGTWRAQTATNSLAMGQSNCWVSFFIQYTSTSGSLSGTLFSNSAISVVGNGVSIVQYNLKAISGTNVSFNHTFSLGVTYHVAMTWNASGKSYCYIDGVAANTVTNPINTAGSTAQFSLGTTGSTPNLSWLISDLAIGNGYSPTPTEIVNLSNRTITPLGVSTPANAWWTLYGSGNPVASTDGLEDLSFNGNDLSAVVGANAIYNSTQLDITPLIELGNLPGNTPAAYVDMTGNFIYFLAQTASSLNGSGATATAIVVAGSISSVSMGSNGTGYNTAPFVYFSGGGGTGAYGVANIGGGQVTSITVLNPGRGYTSAPTITISGVAQVGISAITSNPIVKKNGSTVTFPLCVTSISIANEGTGYTVAPTITIVPGVGDTTGQGATATATVSGGTITTITLKTAGGGYTVLPTVTITPVSGGSGGSATVTIGPFWANVAHSEPWVAYQLPNQALNTDVFTFTAPLGWLVSGFQPMSAYTNASITNFTGQLEKAPLGWGISDFGTNTAVMGVGVNAGWPTMSNNGPYSQHQNWLRRTVRTWVNTLATQPVSVDSSGHPTAILSANGSAFSLLATLGNNPVFGSQGFPMPTGTYTAIMDESAPGSPMTAGLSANTGYVITGGTPSGSGTGKTWQWKMTFGSCWPVVLNPGLQLAITTPGGSPAPGPWTLNKEWFAVPDAFAPSGIGAITMIRIGSGYTSPTFTLNGGGGSGATATITAGAGGLASGCITVIRMLTNGSGYTGTPTVTLTGGSPTVAAVVFPVVQSGIVTSVYIYDPGYGYGSIPTVSFSGGGASVQATAVIDNLSSGVIRSVDVTAAGSGFTAPPTVTIHDSTGSGAIAIALLDSPAQAIDRTKLSSIDNNVVNWLTTPSGRTSNWVRGMDGTWPFDLETNAIEVDDVKSINDFDWSQILPSAQATAVLTSGSISSLKLLWGGENYTTAPTVVVVPSTSGSGANITANLTGGSVTSFNIINGGSYVGTPTIQFIGGNTSNLSRIIQIIQLGPYTPTPGVHDKVFTSDNWPGTVASGPGDPLPWVWTVPPAVGIYYMDGPGLGTLDTQYYVGEATTNVPHGLKTGQFFRWDGNAVTNIQVANLGNTGSPSTINVQTAGRVVAWVTGPTTFAFTIFGGSAVPSTPGAHYGLGNIVSNVSTNLFLTINVPDSGTFPADVLCNFSNAIGSNIHLNVPTSATDALVTYLANLALNNTSSDPDVKLGIEYGNEHWDASWPRNWFLYSYAILQNTGLSIDQFYTFRAGQVHQIFFDIFDAAGRGDQIVRMFGGRTADSGMTGTILTTAATYGYQVDVLLVSDYPNPPTDLPFVSGAALLATQDSRSIMSGASFAWSRAMQSSIIKHDAKYNQPSSLQWPAQWARLANYAGPPTQYGAKPALACYETAVTTYIPPGIDASVTSSTVTIRSQLTTDMQYDPSIYWPEMALYESSQDRGNTFVERFSLCAPHSALSGQDPNLVSVFGAFAWPGQYWGRGDGSDGRFTNLFSSDVGFAVGYDLPNVSVIGQVWRDWADVANPAPVTDVVPQSFGANILVPNSAAANSGIFASSASGGIPNSITGFGISGQVLVNSIA